MNLGRLLLTALCLLLTLLTPFAAQASAVHPLCLQNRISELKFDGVRAVPDPRDFCASGRPIPSVVASLIERIGDQNRAVPTALAMDGKELLGEGVPLLFTAYAGGTIHSYALKDGSRILMTVFPDWDLRAFSKKVYAHELVHFMVYRGTKLTEILAGFEQHPFIEEAFPDLVALIANRDPLMTFDDAGLPECLRIQRDGTPLRSLNLPQRNFHFLAATEQLVACCKGLRDDEKTPGVLALCSEDDLDPDLYDTIAKIGVDIRKPTEQELGRPFDPKACVRRVKGITTFDNCNSRQFSKVLVSFFFSVEKKFGHSFLPLFMQILADDVLGRPTFECGYTIHLRTQKATLRVGSLSKILIRLRDHLGSESEKSSFDRIWNSHALEKLGALDQIYSSANLNALALPFLAKSNPEFQAANGCSTPYTAKPTCALKCL